MHSLLQVWPIDVMQSDHKVSNSAGFLQYCGVCLKRISFSLLSSAVGRAGKLLLPSGVHCFMIFSPNTASLASFIASRVGSLARLSSLYIINVIRLQPCIAPDGSAFSLPLTFFSCGIAEGWCDEDGPADIGC